MYLQKYLVSLNIFKLPALRRWKSSEFSLQKFWSKAKKEAKCIIWSCPECLYVWYKSQFKENIVYSSSQGNELHLPRSWSLSVMSLMCFYCPHSCSTVYTVWNIIYTQPTIYCNNTSNNINNTMEINVEVWDVQVLRSLKYQGSLKGKPTSGSRVRRRSLTNPTELEIFLQTCSACIE